MMTRDNSVPAQTLYRDWVALAATAGSDCTFREERRVRGKAMCTLRVGTHGPEAWMAEITLGHQTGPAAFDRVVRLEIYVGTETTRKAETRLDPSRLPQTIRDLELPWSPRDIQIGGFVLFPNPDQAAALARAICALPQPQKA